MKVCAASFLESTILSAWRRSGVHSLDPGIFGEQDYALSINPSSELYGPDDYSLHIPSDFASLINGILQPLNVKAIVNVHKCPGPLNN